MDSGPPWSFHMEHAKASTYGMLRTHGRRNTVGAEEMRAPSSRCHAQLEIVNCLLGLSQDVAQPSAHSSELLVLPSLG